MRVAIASKIALVLLPLAPVFVTSANQATPQASVRLNDPQFISEGAKLFAPSCGNAYCHGAGGDGGGAPRLRGKDLEAAYVFKSISDGIPGTSMPSFKSELSEEQIWRLVAFVTSDVKRNVLADPAARTSSIPASPGKNDAAPNSKLSPMVGSSQAGRSLFFDSTKPGSCHACHAFHGEGTPIGPDLSAAASRSPRNLFLSIILGRDLKDSKYATITVSLRNGDKILGVKKEEDAESLRVYDTTELPAVLRTIQKSDVANVEYSNESVMPKDYAATFTMKQLLDLVTYLKSSPQSSSAVTLKDLFQ